MSTENNSNTYEGTVDRRQSLSILAIADDDQLKTLMAAGGFLDTGFEWIRPPEIGSIMVQGRAGGTGDPFNLGEVSVTRCTLKVGELVGHGYVQGRAKGKAQRAALCDALLQSDQRAKLDEQVIQPLLAAQAKKRLDREKKAAATKVDFFTLVRGED